MSRCGCLSLCNCSVKGANDIVAGTTDPCITVNVTGSGSLAQPYVVHASPVIPANAPDGSDNLLECGATGLSVSCENVQECIAQEIGPALAGTCLVYTDNGNASGKINVQIADTPTTNGIKCTAGGLEVIPSTDVGNTTVLGTDGNIYTPGGSTIQGDCITITGTGTGVDPFVVSTEVNPACPQIQCGANGLCVDVQVQPLDTATVDMVVTGTGAAGDPFIISANSPTVVNVIDNAQNIDAVVGPADTITFTCVPVPITTSTVTNAPCISVQGDTCNGFNIELGISPDPCNILSCHGNGLFATPDPFVPPPDVSSNNGPFSNIGPFNGNVNTVVDGPHCFTWTNTSTCRSAIVNLASQFTIDQRLTGGTMRVLLERNLNGGPFASSLSQFSGGPANSGANYQATEVVAIVPPGGTFTACVQLRLVTSGAVNAFISTVSYTGALQGRLI